MVPTNDNSNDDGIVQDDGHTPAKRLTERFTASFFDMVNWQLSKQGMHWPVLHDHIAGLRLELTEDKRFYEVDCWSSTGFLLDYWLMSS